MVVVSGCSGAAKPPAPPIPSRETIPGEALRGDVRILREALESIHPGLYRYNSTAEMTRRFDALEDQLGRGATRAEVFRAINELTASIRCGHTFPSPYNQSEAVTREIFITGPKLPFRFRWLGDRMVVTGGASVLPAGTEVLAIDGRATADILRTLLPVTRADGGNDAKRRALLSDSGKDRHRTFDYLHALYFPHEGPAYRIDARLPDGGTTTTLVTPASDADIVASMDPKADPPADAPLWELQKLDERTAYLPMATWVAYRTKWDWQGFINRTFDDLIDRNVPALVIDLRGNEGGSGVGDVILARLIDAPIPESDYLRFTRYRTTPVGLNAVLDTWDDTFRNWGKSVSEPIDLTSGVVGMEQGRTVVDPSATGGYRLNTYYDGEDAGGRGAMIAPGGRRYTGRVIVLIDASNSSATHEFAAAMKRHGLGMLVGETTGGNMRGINGGAFFFLRLPGSGIAVDLPIIATFPKPAYGLPPDAGVAPDVAVEPTIADIADGRDTVLERARELATAPQVSPSPR